MSDDSRLDSVPAADDAAAVSPVPGIPRRRRAGVRYFAHLDRVAALSVDERSRLAPVASKYKFRANDYYLSLVDWDDPADPIRRIVIPDEGEAQEWGRLDASNERAHTVAPGVQHKYAQTVLLLVNEVCGAYCRYCFRKRLFMDGNDETTLDVGPGLDYIRAHPEVTNVLLTGGDPLLVSTPRIESILRSLASIPHVSIVRFGSKMPAFNPFRILDDPELLRVLEEFAGAERKVYLMAHFDHPRELTPEATAALHALQRAGVVCVNQCPLLRGINDDPATLRELFRRTCHAGAPQYYVFQGRPTAGNAPFELPLVEAWSHFHEAQKGLSGLAKRARFVMSHETGKLEVMQCTADRIYLRYHRARDPGDRGRFLVYERDDRACWLDDLVPVGEAAASVSSRAEALGPE
jgi:lysine 2,3-aminomutase